MKMKEESFMIDWKKLAMNYQDSLLNDLQTMISIASARDTAHKTADELLGPGPSKALQQFLAFAKRDGFITKNVDNVAGRIEYGQGKDILGVFAHVDVVPAGDGWQTDPFKAKIHDGKIIGRGASDDKGPGLAAYYALKLLKDQGLMPQKTIHFILGTDEESGWYGLHHYLSKEPTPDFGFSPDAEFPIINGEKGIVSFVVKFDQPVAHVPNDQMALLTFHAGLRPNMVPQDAKATLQITSDEQANDVKTAFMHFLADQQLKGTITQEDDEMHICLQGVGVHAMNPKVGRNAGTFLAIFLDDLALDAAGQNYVHTITKYMHKDFDGTKLGITHHDDLMGDLTASPDMFNFDRNSQPTVLINVRYPQGTDADTMNRQMQQTLAANAQVMTEPGNEVPHYVAKDDPLVTTLLKVYEDHTHQSAHEQIIGGGTYGRLLKRGVAYGALFPNRENVMHQPNEYMYIDDIMASVAIYADALYRLTQAK